MPIWLRRFYIKKVNEFHQKQNEAREEAQNNQGNSATIDKLRFNPKLKPTSPYSNDT